MEMGWGGQIWHENYEGKKGKRSRRSERQSSTQDRKRNSPHDPKTLRKFPKRKGSWYFHEH